nr:epididymal sperm-binding protein 1-like [Lepeophtheirus salmonis]
MLHESPSVHKIYRMKICLSIIFFAQLSWVYGESCQTTDNQGCVFPFKFRENTYNKCTKADWNTYWCATSVNNDGSFATFGNCNNDCSMDVHEPSNECLTTGGFPCIFPFTYAGTTYNKCTEVSNNGVKWCAINKYPGTSDAFHFENCDMNSQCA